MKQKFLKLGLVLAVIVVFLYALTTYAVTVFQIQQGGTATSTAQTNGIWFYDGTSFKQDLNNLVWDISNTRLGIGTSTPGSILSIGGVANFTTATSTFYGSGGIDISSGCFAIAGTCVGGGGGGGTPGGSNTQIQFNDSSSFGGSAAFTFDKNLGYLGLSTSTNAVVIGDTTGNSRGADALDIQTYRSGVTKVANGANAITIGGENVSAGTYGTSIGYNNSASAFGSTCLGFQNTCSGTAASAVGYANTSGNTGGFAGGVSNSNNGANYSYAVGASNSVSSGAYGALGHSLTVSGSTSYAIGRNFTNSTANTLMLGMTDPTLTLNSSGNAGVGTSSPYAKLTVWGAGTTTATTFEVVNSASSTAMKILDNGETYIDNLFSGALTLPTDGGVLSLVDMPVTSSLADNTVVSYTSQIDGNPVLTVYGQSNGSGGVDNLRVGIASTTPTGTLGLSGTFYWTGGGSGTSGNAVCRNADGQVIDSGTQLCSTSSRRFKENEVPLKDALAFLMELQAKAYDRKDNGKHEVGFIAEDLRDIVENYPEFRGLVEYEPDGVTPRGVDYIHITAPIVEAIQEQQAQIDDLKNKINSINREKQGVTPFNIILAIAVLGLGVLVIRKK